MNAWGEPSWIRPHPEYLRLDRDLSGRLQAYRGLFSESLPAKDLDVTRRAPTTASLLETPHFAREFEVRFGRMQRGRPPRTGSTEQGKHESLRPLFPRQLRRGCRWRVREAIYGRGA